MTTVKPMIRVIMMIALLFSASVYSKASEASGDPAPQYALLETAMSRYYEIAKNGGWPTIKPTKKFYQRGETAPAVKDIKKRLQITGDLAGDDSTQLFTPELTEAVKRVQIRFGYKPNGVVDAQLIQELNVPVTKRIQQLEANLERLKQAVPVTATTRLVANIPEFKLHVYEGDRHVFDMNIVVGSESNKTVVFNDEMKHIVFSPYWNVPPSIVKNEILPAMRGNRNYLWRNRYVQTGTENGLPVIRQLPGPKNSLGKVKFVFPNSHNIYFHDTPAKSLFEIRKRAFSHGCIRLAEPEKLAIYLLRNRPEWNPSAIQKAMDSGKEQTVALNEPVAISITYYTAWVDKDGLLHFREDIYGHDGTSGKIAGK